MTSQERLGATKQNAHDSFIAWKHKNDLRCVYGGLV